MPQYWDYLVKIVNWDFGPSFKYRSQTVNDLINDGFPVSLALGAEAILIAVAVGVLLGVIAALNHNKWPDYSAMVVAVFGISMLILYATLLQYFLAIKLNIFSCCFMGNSYAHGTSPALALAAAPMAYIARLTRSSMLKISK